MNIKDKLTEDNLAYLSSILGGVTADDFEVITGKSLHGFMVPNDALAISYEGVLVFFGKDTKEQERFLYYMGAEREAELFARDPIRKISVWSNIDEARLGGRDFDAEEEEEDDDI